MAANLVRAGYRVTVHARRPEAVTELVASGARSAATGRQVATGNRVIIDMLQDLDQLEPLLEGPEGIFAGIDGPATLVVCSSVTPQSVRELAARAGAATGGLLQVLDAPVSGGTAGATAGTLAIMLGGPEDQLEPARSVLSACGTVTHCGPLGAGEVVKACNQLMVAVEMVALSEAALLAESAGVAPAVMFDVLSHGWGASAVLDAKREAIERRDYRPTGVAKFMIKDLGAALGEGGRAGVQMPITTRTVGLYEDLVAAGLGDCDLAVMHKFLQDRSQAPARG